MKKMLFVLILAMTMLLILPVHADEVIGDELIENGDFDFNTGTELAFPDPVFDSDYGDAEDWGSGAWDSYAKAIVDPDDEDNTVAKLSYTVEGSEFSSFFRFTTIEPETTYDISIDYRVEGTTDNLGMRFAGEPMLGAPLLDHESKTAITGKDGWYNVQFQLETDPGSAYDSIAVWFNTGGSDDNYALIDNIEVVPEGGENIIDGGDFEGFLDYAPQADLEETPDSYGFFGQNGTVGDGDAQLENDGILGHQVETDQGKYRVAFEFTVSDLSDVELSFMFADDSENALGETDLVTEGTIDDSFVTLEDETYHVVVEIEKDAATSLQIHYTGAATLHLDNLSLKEVLTVPDNPFDPDETYYTGPNLIVNGDFEAFPVDTVFSESQLEGAWGSVSLDGPATIEEVDGSKVMALGKTDDKTYSSAFVIMPPELDVDDLIRISYDFKIETEDPKESYTAIDSSLVGAANESYYTIDHRSLEDGDVTSGEELLKMPLVVTDLGDGWKNVTLDLKVDSELLIKANSLRWLFTPLHEDDAFYVDNVEMRYLTDTETDIDIEIIEETVTVEKGGAFDPAANVTTEADTVAYSDYHDVNQPGRYIITVATSDEVGNRAQAYYILEVTGSPYTIDVTYDLPND